MDTERSYFGIINTSLTENSRKRGFTWAVVRNFGELLILSRASYLMLVLVPLLAGLWPSVTTLVNQHNQIIEIATERLDIASDKLIIYHNKALEFSPNLILLDKSIFSLKKELDSIKSRLNDRSIESKVLPRIWVLSFIASLCSVIAQVIYQISVPSIVKRSSEREYINKVIDDELKIQDNTNAVGSDEINGLIVRISEEYQDASQSNIVSAIFSMFFYSISILIIILIIIDQTLKVISAAGWI